MTNDANNTAVLPAAAEHHAKGAQLYVEGRFQEALVALEEALSDDAALPSDYWNDWGAAAFALGQLDKAEKGFARALQLNPADGQAAANLGGLLAAQGRPQEAISPLEIAAARVDEAQRQIVSQLLASCRRTIAEEALRKSHAAFRELVTRLQPEPQSPPEPAPNVPVVQKPPVYMGNNRALLCTRFDCKMLVDTTDLLIAPWLLLDGEWEPEETALFKRLFKPGQLFVDVGANLGYYSLLAAKLGASKVYAFEPQPSTFELLGKNVIINWMTKIIQYENLAAYSETRDLTFFIRKGYPGNSSIGNIGAAELKRFFDTSEEVKVPAVSLDDYFADKPAKIDLLKIDVEGAEPAAFEGARELLKRNPDIRILCEWSPDQMAMTGEDPSRLIKLWKELGLRAFSFSGGLRQLNIDSLPQSPYVNLLLHR